jgi:cytoskeletal protein RodZ
MATLTSGNVRQSAAVSRFSSGDESVAFGDFLRQARERRGLTLQQIARETKIPFRHLDALEHGNLSDVPQGIYRRAEIRAFAQSVGLDQSVALAELERALQASQPRKQTPPSALRRPVRHLNRGLVAAFIGLSALAASALSLWTRGMSTSTEPQPSVLIDTAASTSAASTSPASTSPASTPATPAVAEPAVDSPIPQAVVAVEAPPAAIPSVEDGELTIVTEPAGARVTIDGVGRGTTPLTVAHLPFGLHRIRVTLDGHLGEQRVSRIDATRPTETLTISLTASQ